MAKEDVHSYQCYQQAISVQEVEGLFESNSERSFLNYRGGDLAYHRPLEFLLASYKWPVKSQGDYPLPAV